ncbi:TonB-dependent receptor [Marinihelvus fidelis]|nr:TonB-dependent receptor [Marinihelvus fidelis]
MKSFTACHLFFGALGATTLLPAATALAQVEDDERVSGVLEEVVVTATRREESLQDVPISIATLKGEALDSLFSAGEDVLALSGRVPGLYLESSNGRAAPRFYIRGLGNIDFDLGASQPVSFIMDDVVLENVVLKSFPMFDVDQVEVIRGPQGSLFGRNTTAGIVKVDTKRPTQETEGYVSGSLGTFMTGDLEAALGGGLGDSGFSFRASGIYRTRDDWIDNGYTGEDDAMGGYTEKAARLQLQWESDSFRALLMAQGRDLDGTASIFRANVFDTGSNDLNQNYDRDQVWYDGGDNNPQGYEGTGYTLNLDWTFGNGATLTSITSFQEADGFSRGDIDGGVVDFTQSVPVPPGITFDPAAINGPTGLPTLTFPGSIYTDSVTQDAADTDQFTQELRLASDTSGAFSWQTGAYWFDSDLTVTTDSFASLGFQDTIVNYGNEAWAVFGQGELDLGDRVSLIGGLRYTDDSKDYHVVQYSGLWEILGIPAVAPLTVSDDQVSWDLAANFSLTDDSVIFGRVASGFRGPTIQGRDVAFLEFPTIADSETVLSFELGYKADLLDDRLRLNAAVFTYEVDDIQLSIIGGASNSNQVINADKGKATGFEMDLTWLATDNLLLTFGMAYNDTEIDSPGLTVAPCGSTLCEAYQDRDANGQVSIDGNPLPRTPETNYSLTARWSLPMGGSGEFFVFTDWVYYGETLMSLYYTPEFVTDDQFEGGLKVGYLNFENNWEVALFGRNITDEDNVKGFVDFSNLTGFVNEPAVWGVEASYRFGGN